MLLELRGRLDHRVIRVSRVSKVWQVPPEQREPLDRPEPREMQELLVPLDPQERQVLPEPPGQPVHRVMAISLARGMVEQPMQRLTLPLTRVRPG